MNKVLSHSKKVLVGIVGGTIVLIGLVLVPYPGPGWLVVFAGMAVLASEFEFAERILAYAHGKYDAWMEWIARQSWPIRLVVLALTGLVVLVSLWLFNALGLAASFFNIHYDWLTSPLFR